ncbi:MAG TPA: hypothetical protein VJM79_02900, partial [Rhizorhapis sp.]|nr:hypothetical protein [Rhizorhapis sp.]
MWSDSAVAARQQSSAQGSGTAARAEPERRKTPLRVLMVAENISLRQSGETSVPFYYLEHFVRRGL